MTAQELIRIVSDWSDALTVAEVVSNPLLRVTDRWDLHDWDAVDVPDGLLFRHMSEPGQVTESVLVAPDEEDSGVSVVCSLPVPLPAAT